MIVLATAFAAAATHLVGFGFVLLVLTVLWGLTGLMSRLLPTPKAATATPIAAVASAPASTQAVDTEAISEEEVVVVTAAVAMLLEERHRIVSIQPRHTDWSREGRRQHFASHRLR